MEDELTKELQEQRRLLDEAEAELTQQKMQRHEKQQEIDVLIEEVESFQEIISKQQKKMDSDFAEIRIQNNELKVLLAKKDKEVTKMKKDIKQTKNSYRGKIADLEAEKNSAIESVKQTANENEKRVIEALAMVDDRESMMKELEIKFRMKEKQLQSALDKKEDTIHRIELDYKQQHKFIGEIIKKVVKLNIDTDGDGKFEHKALSNNDDKHQIVGELEDAIISREKNFRVALNAKDDVIVQLKSDNQKCRDDLKVSESKEQLVLQLRSELSTHKERLCQLESEQEKEKEFFSTKLEESKE
eukprot:11067722-Ditylum_brightwellii.AAC.1